MSRHATIVFLHNSGEVFVTETFPMEKVGVEWVTKDGKLRTRYLGLQRADGKQGRIVEPAVDKPQFQSLSDYFIFVGQTEAEVTTFAAGVMVMRAAYEVGFMRMLAHAATSEN